MCTKFSSLPRGTSRGQVQLSHSHWPWILCQFLHFCCPKIFDLTSCTYFRSFGKVSGRLGKKIFKCTAMQVPRLFSTTFWNFWHITHLPTTNSHWVINAKIRPLFVPPCTNDITTTTSAEWHLITTDLHSYAYTADHSAYLQSSTLLTLKPVSAWIFA